MAGLTLRPLREEDITERYLEWFRDPEVTRYLDAHDITREDAIEHLRRSGQYVFAIEVDGVHIGNVKVGPLDQRHGLADLVTVIGDRDYWGKGYATEVVQQAMEIAWSLGVRKLAAGIHGDNVGSLKAYLRAGFVAEGRLADHYMVDGKPQDRVCVSAWNPALQLEG